MTPRFKRGDRWSKIDADDMNRLSDAAWRVLDYRGGPGRTVTNSPSGIRMTEAMDHKRTTPRDIPVVVRDVRDGIVWVNQVTFASVILNDIRYRWIAGEFEAYPDFGHTADEYEDFKFTEPQPTIDATYLTATWIDGSWLVKFPATGGGTTRAHFWLFHWTFQASAFNRDNYVWGLRANPDGTVDNDPPIDIANPASYTPIAKPFHLRRIAYDGKGFTHPDVTIGARTYTYGSPSWRTSRRSATDVETQWITRAYEATSVIVAEQVGSGFVGLQTEGIDGPLRDISWVEVDSGRDWAAEQA